MSDLPEKIRRVLASHVQWSAVDDQHILNSKDFGAAVKELSDLAPVIGYSREQMREAMECLADWVHDKMPSTPDMTAWINSHLATLTPAAQPKGCHCVSEGLPIDQHCPDCQGTGTRIASKTYTAQPQWKSGGEIAEEARKRFDEIAKSYWDYRSFYNGYLEGATASSLVRQELPEHRPVSGVPVRAVRPVALENGEDATGGNVPPVPQEDVNANQHRDPRAFQTFEEWFAWLTKQNGQSYEKTDPIYQWADLAWHWKLKAPEEGRGLTMKEIAVSLLRERNDLLKENARLLTALKEIADGFQSDAQPTARDAMASGERGT